MFNWTDALIDESKKKISAIFGNEIPSLSSVDLHEIKIHGDGPSVYLNFDLPDYPSSPPKKWTAQGCNCVQLELMFITVDASGLVIKGWGESNVELNIKEEENKIKLLITSESMHLELSANFLMISKITAYLREAI